MQLHEYKQQQMSRRIRKATTCMCENKGADQLCSNCTANQRLRFRFKNSTIPEISSLHVAC